MIPKIPVFLVRSQQIVHNYFSLLILKHYITTICIQSDGQNFIKLYKLIEQSDTY